MSENEKPKAPETKEACETAGGTWNSETGTCTMPKPAPEEKALADMTPLELMAKANKDIIEQNNRMLREELGKQTQDVITANKAELNQQYRRAIGIKDDQPLYTSDIPQLMEQFRKAALENQENRSPTGDPLKKGNPDGTAKKDDFDEAVERKFKEMS